MMKDQLQQSAAGGGRRVQRSDTVVESVEKGLPVFRWSGDPGWHRAPVLPDLRAGGGFTLACWVRAERLGGGGCSKLLVDGTWSVSGSLDEEDADDITKGFTISAEKGGGIRLFVTDGFKTEFEFRVLESAEEWEHYSGGGGGQKLVKVGEEPRGQKKCCT